MYYAFDLARLLQNSLSIAGSDETEPLCNQQLSFQLQQRPTRMAQELPKLPM
jgi:hypothetical protein